MSPPRGASKPPTPPPLDVNPGVTAPRRALYLLNHPFRLPILVGLPQAMSKCFFCFTRPRHKWLHSVRPKTAGLAGNVTREVAKSAHATGESRESTEDSGWQARGSEEALNKGTKGEEKKRGPRRKTGAKARTSKQEEQSSRRERTGRDCLHHSKDQK